MNKSGCCKGGSCVLSMVAKVLLVVGGLNWGLVGVGMLAGGMSSWNLVTMIFGSMPMVEAAVYVLVGISAVVYSFGCVCGKCKNGVCQTCTTDAMPENKV